MEITNLRGDSYGSEENKKLKYQREEDGQLMVSNRNKSAQYIYSWTNSYTRLENCEDNTKSKILTLKRRSILKEKSLRCTNALSHILVIGREILITRFKYMEQELWSTGYRFEFVKWVCAY